MEREGGDGEIWHVKKDTRGTKRWTRGDAPAWTHELRVEDDKLIKDPIDGDTDDTGDSDRRPNPLPDSGPGPGGGSAPNPTPPVNPFPTNPGDPSNPGNDIRSMMSAPVFNNNMLLRQNMFGGMPMMPGSQGPSRSRGFGPRKTRSQSRVIGNMNNALRQNRNLRFGWG